MARSPSLPAEAASRALRQMKNPVKVTADGTVQFDITERRHSRFNLFEKHWRFALESFTGGPEYIYKGMNRPRAGGGKSSHQNLTEINSKNLFQYFKEGDGEYGDRLQRAHRNNYTKKVIEQIKSFIARKPPTRRKEEASDVVTRMWENTDGRGHDIEFTMSTILQWALTFGIQWISIDRPRSMFESRVDELDGGMPFLKFWFPFDVLDGGFDEQENLKWILVREWRRIDDNPFAPSPIIPHFVLWDALGFQVFIQNEQPQGADPVVPFSKVDEGLHGLGKVPFTAVKASDSDDPFLSAGLVDDIIYLDRHIFNLQSQLDTVILDQTFSQLAIPADSVVLNSPERFDTNDNNVVRQHENDVRTRLIEMGTKRVFLFNGQTSHAPRFISPDASQADVIRGVIKDNTDEIYRLAGLLDQVGREVKTQSGTSKSYDFDRINKMLAMLAEQLEQADMWIAQTTEEWMTALGGTAPEIPDDLVSYPENFDIMGLLERLDILFRSDEADLWSPTLDLKQRVRIMDQMEPNLSLEDRKTIMDEMEERKDREVKMAEKLPLDPLQDPAGGADGSETRGPGGGARGPGNSQPAPVVTSTAKRVEGGNKESK